MIERLTMMVLLGGIVGILYAVSMLTIPGRGIMKLLERTAAGAALCFLLHLVLTPLGLSIPQTPLSAVLSGYLGLPGAALSTFLSFWP